MIPYIQKERERVRAVKKRHNLYIVSASHGNKEVLIKLGYSEAGRIQNRLHSYFQVNPFAKLIKTFYREDAKQFEKNFHATNHSITGNEWYFPEHLKHIIKCIREWPIQKEDVPSGTYQKRKNFLEFMTKYEDKKRTQIERYSNIPSQALLHYYDKIGVDITAEDFLYDKFERRPDWYSKILKQHRKKEVRKLREGKDFR